MIRISCLISVVILFLSSSAPAQHVRNIDLNGNWEFRPCDSGSWMPATVPGVVHTDLLANSRIPDPFYACNEELLQWVGTQKWEYRHIFVLDEQALKFPRAELVFEGLDTYADVFLNGHMLFKAGNMFRCWEPSCREWLRKGNNELRLVFYPAALIASQKAAEIPYALPGGERVFVRKAQYHFGWDWGPVFITCGIWKPVSLRLWSQGKISGVQIIQHKTDLAEAALTAVITMVSFEEGLAEFRIADPAGQIYTNRRFILKKGENRIEIPFAIKNPRLWWCNGMGEPNLYRFSISVAVNGQTIDMTEVKTGLRKIELVREPDSIGESFYFKLNGKPVFIMGANYIPQHSFLPTVTPASYHRIISDAAYAGMNMLRVWGGGIYENDIFYDLCDEYGLLVWQDFMFACAMYPGDTAFMNSVETEAIQNVRRLRNHPCIALWCGNNESDEGWHNWGWQKQYGYNGTDSASIWQNYLSLFREMLPGIIASENPEVPYWQSSPKVGWGRPDSYLSGDSHYWGVWWGLEPFGKYREKTGRFASEYGFQAMPDITALDSVIPGKEKYLFSRSLKCHQKHPVGFETIETYMKRDYPVPDNLEDYVYVSQLLQACGIRYAMEAHRRSKPYCMGSLYWQLNDCWPVVSWSGTDFYGNPKALRYFIKEAFAPLLVSFDTIDDEIKVWLIYDGRAIPQMTKINISLMDFSGKRYYNSEITTLPAADRAVCIDTLSRKELLKCGERPSEVVLECAAVMNGITGSRNLLYLVRPALLELPDPGLSITIVGYHDGFQLTIKSSKLAKNVYIRPLNGNVSPADIPENYFDLLPGESRSIFIRTKNPEMNPGKSISIKTLYDIIH